MLRNSKILFQKFIPERCKHTLPTSKVNTKTEAQFVPNQSIVKEKLNITRPIDISTHLTLNQKSPDSKTKLLTIKTGCTRNHYKLELTADMWGKRVTHARRPRARAVMYSGNFRWSGQTMTESGSDFDRSLYMYNFITCTKNRIQHVVFNCALWQQWLPNIEIVRVGVGCWSPTTI